MYSFGLSMISSPLVSAATVSSSPFHHAHETSEQVCKKDHQIAIKATPEASHVMAKKHRHLWRSKDCSDYFTWNKSRLPSAREH